jgi:hypothetical protein
MPPETTTAKGKTTNAEPEESCSLWLYLLSRAIHCYLEECSRHFRAAHATRSRCSNVVLSPTAKFERDHSGQTRVHREDAIFAPRTYVTHTPKSIKKEHHNLNATTSRQGSSRNCCGACWWDHLVCVSHHKPVVDATRTLSSELGKDIF